MSRELSSEKLQITMKLVAAFLAVALPACAQTRGTGVTSQDFSGTSDPTQSLPPWNVQAGGTIVGCGSFAGNSSVTVSVTDSKSANNFTVTDYETLRPGVTRMFMFKAENTTAVANDVVTLHYSSAVTYPIQSAVQYSGTAAAAFDAHAVGNTGGAQTGTTTSAAFTTSQGPEMLVACAGDSFGANILSSSVNTSPVTPLSLAQSGLSILDANLYQIQTGISVSTVWTAPDVSGIIVGTLKSSNPASPPVLSQTFSNYTASVGGIPYIYAGSTASVSFTVTNPNPALSLSSINFSDTLPAPLIVSTPSVVNGSCSGGTIDATAGSNTISLSGSTLSPGASCTFTVNVTGVVAGNAVNTTGSITANESRNGGTATASLAVYGPPSLAISNVVVSAVDHASVNVQYATSGPGYCQLQFGTSSGTYQYSGGTGQTTGGCSISLGGLAPSTTYYLMPTTRPDANDSTGLCQVGGGCGATELTFTTLPLPSIHPVPPNPPNVWTPAEPDVTSYTVVPMQSDPVTGNCEAANNVSAQKNWSAGVTKGDSFQTVMNKIWYDTVIEFAEGSSCNMPDNGQGFHSSVLIPQYSPVPGSSDWIMIRTHPDAATDFPPFGFRTGPQFASKLATLVAVTPGMPYVPGNGSQNFHGQLFDCENTPCSHVWIENLAFTHAFNQTIYPSGIVDPPAFGPYVSVIPPCVWIYGCQAGQNLAGTSNTSLTVANGNISLTTQPGLGYSAGTVLQMINNNVNFLQGSVTTYDPATGAMTANITQTYGGGSNVTPWVLTPPPDHMVIDRVYAYGQRWPSREFACWVTGGNYWAVINSYCSSNMSWPGLYPLSNPYGLGSTIDIPNAVFQFNAFDKTPIGMVPGPGYNGTSATPLAITGSGTLSLTTQKGLSWAAGNLIELLSGSAAYNYMIGSVTSYNAATGALSFTPNAGSGTGTFSDWSLLTPATVTFSGSGFSSYSGTVIAWIGPSGLTIEYQAANGLSAICNGCTATAASSPSGNDIPVNCMYYFNGHYSNGNFTLDGSLPWSLKPTMFSSFRPIGLYWFPGQYGVFDNNYMMAMGQTIYNDSYGLASDLSWTHNYLYFPRSKMQNSGSWDGYGYSFRNVIETKQELRGQYVGNIIDGTASYQNPGNALLVASAYTGPYSTGIQDINITGNVFKHLSSGFQAAGGGSAGVGDPPAAARIAITNNFFLDLNRDLYNNGGGGLASGSFSMYPMGSDINFSNNTVGLTKGSGPALFEFGGNSFPQTSVMGEGLLYSNNLVLASLGGLDAIISIDGGQNGTFSNFPTNPTVAPIINPAVPGTWQNYLNASWIHSGNTITPSWSMGHNLVLGAQNNRGLPSGVWADLTPAQISSSLQSLWPSSDTTTVFPCSASDSRCSGGTTLAGRLKAIGWSPTLNLAGGNPDAYRVSPSIYNPGNIGANADIVDSATGVVQQISVGKGPGSLLFSYVAPDTRACSVDISPDGTSWTRMSDGGGAFSRSVKFTGLTAAASYQYRIMCYFDQTAAYEFLPSQITSGTVSTTSAATRTVFQDFTMPPGANTAQFAFTAEDGSSVNQSCSSSPCAISLTPGNWTRTLTFSTGGSVAVGTPSVTNISIQ